MKKSIPICQPDITTSDKKAVMRALSSGMIAQGPMVEEFETQFAKMCDVAYAIAVNSGTAALHTALYSAGIGHGDEVITTPFTFAATAHAILHVGARPVFADIDEDTFNISPASILKAITPRTKAILPVNLYGQPAEYDELRNIAREYELSIIEDAAQSIGAHFKNQISGNLGEVGCFSLYATKNITCGEGGVITTNNHSIAERARSFRNHGQSPTRRYQYEVAGFNYRLNDILAALAHEQLKRTKKIIQKRQSIAQIYDSELSKIPGLILPVQRKDRTHVFHQYTIRVLPSYHMTRDRLLQELLKKGIETVVYYPKPLYHFAYMQSDPQNFPVSEMLSSQVLSLPIYPKLSTPQISRIITSLKEL